MNRKYYQMVTRHYSIFPAMIVVQETLEGQRLLTPIPVTGPILQHWLWMLVIGILSVAWQSMAGYDLRHISFIGIAILETQDLAARMVEMMQRTSLNLQLSTVLARSLAWGVLGV